MKTDSKRRAGLGSGGRINQQAGLITRSSAGVLSPQQAGESDKEPSVSSRFTDEKENIKKQSENKVSVLGFRGSKLSVGHIMQEPHRQREAAELHHLSGAVGRSSIPMGAHMTMPTMNAFIQKDLKKRNRTWIKDAGE